MSLIFRDIIIMDFSFQIGPYFFDQAVTGVRYLEMLREHLPLMLNPNGLPDDELPIIERNIFFQQDGAPPHYQGRNKFHLKISFQFLL